MTPARRTDPPVGASTCASGSHVWKGTEGILTMNPKNSRTNTMAWKASEVCGIRALMFSKEKSMTPPFIPMDSNPMAKIPISMTRDATCV